MTPDDIDDASGPNEVPALGSGVPVEIPRSLHGPAWEWSRRIGIAVAIAFGLWLIVLAASRSETTLDQGTGDARVASRFPSVDAIVQDRIEVGVQLQEGFDGTMYINGVVIPEEQLTGAVDPSTLSADDLARYGVRAGNRNRIFFTPGPGKVFEKLPKGEITVTIQYHRDRQPSVDTGSTSWTFTVV